MSLAETLADIDRRSAELESKLKQAESVITHQKADLAFSANVIKDQKAAIEEITLAMEFFKGRCSDFESKCTVVGGILLDLLNSTVTAKQMEDQYAPKHPRISIPQLEAALRPDGAMNEPLPQSFIDAIQEKNTDKGPKP